MNGVEVKSSCSMFSNSDYCLTIKLQLLKTQKGPGLFSKDDGRATKVMTPSQALKLLLTSVRLELESFNRNCL